MLRSRAPSTRPAPGPVSIRRFGRLTGSAHVPRFRLISGLERTARIDPEEAAIGRPTQTARRLVEASVSPNTRLAYAGALRRLDAWLDGRPLHDVTLAAYLAELHDAGRASSSASMAVAAACFREKLVGQLTPAGERTARMLAGWWSTRPPAWRAPAWTRRTSRPLPRRRAPVVRSSPGRFCPTRALASTRSLCMAAPDGSSRPTWPPFNGRRRNADAGAASPRLRLALPRPRSQTGGSDVGVQ